MSRTEALAEMFFTVFNSLNKNEKEMIVEKLLKDIKLREDLKDIISALDRQKEKSIPYAKVHKELKTTKRL